MDFDLTWLLWGLPIAPLGFSSEPLVSICLVAVIGVANSVEDVAGFTLLQRVVPNRFLAGALGVFWGLAMGGTAVGSVAASGAVARLGTEASFVVVAAVLPFLLLLTYRKLNALDASVTPAAQLEMIEGVPMFAPLSLAAKEQIASALVQVTAEPGDVVIRRGDVGDSFYIVADGRLTAEVAGVETTRDAGAYFGEIALLRDVPRTATVRATTRTRLYALQRDDFLAVLSGHRSATTAATAVAEARLARS